MNRLVWLVVPIGISISIVTSLIWLYLLPDPHIAFYKQSIFVYALSSIIALCSEVGYVLTQISLHTNVKVFVESTSLSIRSITNCILLCLFPSLGLKGFCIGEFVYALCFPLLYGVQIYRLLHNPETSSSLPIQSFAQLLPSFTLPTDSSKVLLLFFRQSLLKQLLTEGERYILSFSSISMHDQGVFDIVNNLGSLFARFLFQPLEEGFYLYFSREGNRAGTKNQTILHVCLLLLRCLSYFGCIVIGFGYPYASVLLFLYGGSQLATSIAVTLLRVYCVYVLFLGLNGISEAFFMATAETSRLERYNYDMILFSIAFVLAARIGTPFLGSVGYIVANIVNMGCRCVHHFSYLSHYAEKPVMRDIAVAPLWLLYEIGVCAILGYLETFFKPFSMRSVLCFVGIGACGGISVLIVMWLVDSTTIQAARAIFSKETKPAAKLE